MSTGLLAQELGVVQLASPCDVSWSSMKGNDKVRHCAQCKLNVFNAESMSSFEVRDLLIKTEGRLCMRFFRRFDGTLLTQDCPKGLALLKIRWAQQKKKATEKASRVSMAEYLIIIGLIAGAAIGIITMFGDNIRRLFGTSTGALAGDGRVATAPRRDSRGAVIRHYQPECPNPALAASQVR